MNVTERTIYDQFSFWREAPLPQPLRDTGATYVLIGCGSSYNLALSIAAKFNEKGLTALAVPAGEWLYRREAYVADVANVVVIALSRSGESTETVRAAAASREKRLPVTAIVCDADSSLARNADVVHAAETHPEEGIVMTASASLMLLLGYALAGVAVDPTVADRARGVLDAAAALDLELLEGRSHFVFLGGGTLYGIALEGALKLQEMSLNYTQCFHPLEYRHGPISLVDERSAIVLLYHPDTASLESTLCDELTAKAGLVIGFGGKGDVSLNVPGPTDLIPLTCLPALQILGERLAQRRGIDTRSPRHLTKVVSLRS
jgi:glucosamine--fructose-6-phosphate aminotransferase (isomerizing)